VRIGLTRAQVNAIRNPRLSQGIEVKLSDSWLRSGLQNRLICLQNQQLF
jgi:hypothetical protein